MYSTNFVQLYIVFGWLAGLLEFCGIFSANMLYHATEKLVYWRCSYWI